MEKREKYLGKKLPNNLDSIKQEFMVEIYRERWFDDFDLIKAEYASHRKSKPPSARAKEMKNFSIKYIYNTNKIEGYQMSKRQMFIFQPSMKC